MVYNGNDKGRTKHIDIRFHYIREMIANNKKLVVSKICDVKVDKGIAEIEDGDNSA